MAALLAAPVMGILLLVSWLGWIPAAWAVWLGGGLLGWFFAGGVVGSALGGASTRRSASA